MHGKFYLPRRPKSSNFLLFIFCCFLSSLLSISTVYAQLSGTYTIGGADGNYAGFSQAAAALQAQGVSGPVTFQVRPGTYQEQLTIGTYAGNSCNNPVVFEGTGVAAGQVILQSPEEASPTLMLNGPDGISFRNISVTGQGTVIETTPGTSCFSLENSIVKGSGGPLVYARSGTDGSSNFHTYRNNTFLNGTNAILKENQTAWNPQSPVFDDGLLVEGNQFRGQRETSVNINGQQEFTISRNQLEVTGSGIVATNSWYGKAIIGNTIRANVGDYKGTGITLTSAAVDRITKNYISLSEGGYGIKITTGKTRNNEMLIANNLVDVSGYDARGHNYFPISNLVGFNISNNYENKIKIYHNTIRVSGYSENVPNYTFSATGLSNSFHILNNVLANSSYGTVLLADQAAIAEMDYNNLYSEYATLFASLNGREINSLTEWKNITPFGDHSIAVNPVNPEDPNEKMLGAGYYLEEVPEDLYGQKRNNPPAIGAVEGGNSGQALSGTYTIGGESSDYETFAAAIAALETLGVQESVVFKIQPGEYYEYVNIQDFRNPDVHIAFEGAGDENSAVVLNYSQGNVLSIRNSRNITFRNMTIASGISLSNSSHLLFEKNVILGGVNAGSVNNDTYRNNHFQGQGIEKNSEGFNQTHGHLYTDGPVVIEENTFEVQGRAISLFAQTGVKINRNTITIEKSERTTGNIAIELSSGRTVEVNNNTILSYQPGTTGISFGGAFSGDLPETIMNNRISLPAGGTGIYFYYGSDGGSLVANNLISVKADDGSTGIAVYSSGDGINFFFNSVYLYGNGSESKVFYFEVDYEEPVNVHFKNNIFANLAGGYVLYEKLYDNIKRLASSDYNDLYTNGEKFAFWEENLVPDLNHWQAVTGFDEHSISVNPQFESAENLIPLNNALYSAGMSIEGIDTDFFGKPRNSPPAIGAAEPQNEPKDEGPEAKAGRDKTLVLPENSIILSGIANVENGRFIAFKWEKVSGPSATMAGQNTANVKLTDLQEGEYVFRFSATDNQKRTASDEMTLMVKAGEPVNQVPVVKAGRDKTVSLPVHSYILRGTGEDPDGRFVAFRWEKVSGPSVSMAGERTANVRLSDLEAGEYVFRFSATDNEGATASDDMVLTVNDENRPPVVQAGKDVSITTAYTQYILSGIGHVPDGGRFTAFRWEKVSGPSVTLSGENTANLKISDFEEGAYTFRFSATDNRGITAADEVTVTVAGAAEAPAPPVLANRNVVAFPNTFRSFVNVKIEAEEPDEYQIMVFDMLGKVVYQSNFVPDSFNSATHEIDFSGQIMQEGAYYVRVENQEGSFRKMLKIVKSH